MDDITTAFAKLDSTSWLLIAVAVGVAAWGNWQQLSKIHGQFAGWFKRSPLPPVTPSEPGLDEIVLKLIESWKALVERGEMEAAREVGEAIVSALRLNESEQSKPQAKRQK